ncbi:MAG: hypothetical protein LBT13_04030 [Treponema sp.]|jgi:hypothetical protein|nr:hypothetical protein [Treponema sp.]
MKQAVEAGELSIPCNFIQSSIFPVRWVLDAAGVTVLKNTRDFAPGLHHITSKLITEGEEVYSSKMVEFID